MARMLKRFSLYGFLKNQQYYDYFLILAFRQMGLSFFMIGTLIAFRELVVALMEVPTGAIADIFGRRRCMAFSFLSYIVSFAIFGSVGLLAVHKGISQYALLAFLFFAMMCFAIGDAFRTGTHKAMIFRWLDLEGRAGQGTRVYGYTRSWSKIGSAVSVVVACVFVFLTSNFIYVFFLTIIPYVLSIVNLLGYPEDLDGDRHSSSSIRDMMRYLKEALIISVRRADLRRLMLESMGFEGFFKAARDYLQPILQKASLPLVAALFTNVEMTVEQRSVFLIGPIYFLLFILSAVASRKAYFFSEMAGKEDKAAWVIWGMSLFIFLFLTPAMYYNIYWIMITGFVFMYILQNIWRPVLISRFSKYAQESMGATILSIESQAKSVSTMIIAPLLGLAVDMAGRNHIGLSKFWPLGVLGAIITLVFFLAGRKR